MRYRSTPIYLRVGGGSVFGLGVAGGRFFPFFLIGGSLGFRAVGVALLGPLFHNGSLLCAVLSSSNTERPMRYFYPGRSQNFYRTHVKISATSTQESSGIFSMQGAPSGEPIP